MTDKDFIKDLGGEYPGRDEIKEAEFKEVYAGPEYFMEQDNSSEDIDEEEEQSRPGTMLIYGGPMLFGKKRAKAGEAPDQVEGSDDIAPMMCVYAGPEYFKALKNKITDAETQVCNTCGASFSSSLKYCPECGTKISSDGEVTKA